MSTVLVTGGSGFVASHIILQLLAAGHRVRATVRNPNREGDVRAMLKAGGADPGERLAFFTADLENDAGWREAVAGCIGGACRLGLYDQRRWRAGALVVNPVGVFGPVLGPDFATSITLVKRLLDGGMPNRRAPAIPGRRALFKPGRS